MPSSFSPFFRKNDGQSPTEPCGNEDLECGHGSQVQQRPTASGYQSSPSRVYLPEQHSIHASLVPQTPIPSSEYYSHAQHNGQHGSAAQLSCTPSGLSRVEGYLPRTLYSNPSPFVGPTRLVMPSQLSQSASNSDFMSNRGPQRRSASISSSASHEFPSPLSPFDPRKHGQALRRLETHGSLKTMPCSQQEGATNIRASITWSQIGREIFEEDHTPGHQGLLPRQPVSQVSAEPNEAADQRFGAEASITSIQYLPSTVYQPTVSTQEDPSKVVNLSHPPETERGRSFRDALQSFVFPLINTEVDNSAQATEQALHRSQVSCKPHQTLHLTPSPGEPIAANVSPNLRSTNASSDGVPENNETGSILRKNGTPLSEYFEDMSAYEAEGEEDQGDPTGDPLRECPNPAHDSLRSPSSHELDEFVWSPSPSDDGEEVPSSTRTFPNSGLTPDPYSGSSPNEPIHFRSGLSGDICVTDSPLPHIDVLIPDGTIDLGSHPDFLSSSQHASTMESRESSSVLFRYSGIITDGPSSRPMSEIELKEEALHALEDRAKCGLTLLSSRNSTSQTDYQWSSEQTGGEHEPNARPKAFILNQVQTPSADDGPGSSQTSSSLSTGRFGSDVSGHNARSDIYDLVSLRNRCPTPPLLFGKRAIHKPIKSRTQPMPVSGGANDSLDPDMKATRPEKTGRLPTTMYSLGGKDWETISAKTEANTHAFDGITFNSKTGSSLADNSDSGSLSLSQETPSPLRGVQARPALQHPPHPRLNHSYMLIRNSQTGELVQVPQYEYEMAGRLPDHNTSAPLVLRAHAENTYQHPSPMRVEHNHPFTSSPPIIRFTKPSQTSCGDSRMEMQQKHSTSDLSGMGVSEGVQGVGEKSRQDSLYKTNQDSSYVGDPAVDQTRLLMNSNEQSHQSSAWLSTVSEVTSSEPSLPGNGRTFTRVMVLDEEGHVNGRSEQGGNQEVGSSLADTSSPGVKHPSSSGRLANSPMLSLDALSSPRLHNQAHHFNFDYSNQHLPARPFSGDDLATLPTNTADRSRSYSASGLQQESGKSSPRRRRSSSESHSRPMDSSTAHKASALNASSSNAHAQQNPGSRLVLRNPFSLSDDNDSQLDSNQKNVIERRGRQLKADDLSSDHPTTPSSTASRPFVQDGVVHTDVPSPIFHHPVYGLDRPWDRVKPVRPRPRPNTNPLGRPRLQRPIARAESPHLYRIPRPPTTELLERHVLLSRIYLVSSMMIPPVALIYGHGYMDGVMRFHTADEMDGFREMEKTIALCWGYGVSAICILAAVITIIIISTSV